MFENWAEDLYESTFSEVYDTLIAEYKEGNLSVEQLQMNLAEQQQILLNAFNEGEVKSAYCNAMVDAHQFALSMVKQGKIVRG